MYTISFARTFSTSLLTCSLLTGAVLGVYKVEIHYTSNACDAYPNHLLHSSRVQSYNPSRKSPAMSDIIQVTLLSIYSHRTIASLALYRRPYSPFYNGGSRNSLHELEKNATATPKTATLLTTLAFSGEVKVLYALVK